MGPLVVAGASRGFSVLLVGGVVQPWVGHLLPALGYVWLLLVAVAAFAWAARPRAVSATPPSELRSERALVGTTAALGSYALVLPLVLSVADAVPVAQVALTSLTALTVGALAGALLPVARTA